MAASLDLEVFKALDANPEGTLQKFNHYTERTELLFQLVFPKTDGTGYSLTDRENKAMLLFKGGDDMHNIVSQIGKVLDTDMNAQAVKKIKDGLPRGPTRWSNTTYLLQAQSPLKQEICNTGEHIDYE